MCSTAHDAHESVSNPYMYLPDAGFWFLIWFEWCSGIRGTYDVRNLFLGRKHIKDKNIQTVRSVVPQYIT